MHRMAPCFGSALILFFVCLSPAFAENDPRLESQLQPLVDAHRGEVSIAVRELGTGVEYRHRAERPMPTASLIKFPVMIEAYRQADAGKISLDASLELRDEDKVPGSGILTTHFSPGTRISLRDAVRLMIAYSDNTATNLVLDQIGLASTAETMQAWGLPHSKIHAKVFRRDTSVFPERSREFGLGSTTAGEMVTLLERLHCNELVSAEACERMREHLLACQDRTKISRFLPAEAKFAHKTGAVNEVRCDAGILYLPNTAVAVCVLTNRNLDRSWGTENAAEILCGRVGEIVWRRFALETAAPTPADLRLGASGPLVEDLQRTLNARLTPSPSLPIDGEFGPATELAVREFQQQQKLPVNGVAGGETLRKLGQLVTADAPVESIEQINSEPLPLEPADPLDGAPFVTCKGWILVDGETGDVVAHREGETSRPMASTTKMMTAFLALKAIEAEPGLADSIITFSERADRTPGSTSALRAGEQVPLRELLYGLLLPSGNDASVAIAEHLGSRYPASVKDEDQSAYARFVHQMNETAKELGMTDTHYANPHGLSADGHRSSPRDLAILAREAMSLEEFRKYVSTRQRACTVESVTGYRRNVLWTNTNQLLKIEGYDGVKTGTTNDAGACLVSSARRDGTWLICVVLGSTSADARYTDTRNLFRWGFQQAQAASGK